jgi:hypothetical protein
VLTGTGPGPGAESPGALAALAGQVDRLQRLVEAEVPALRAAVDELAGLVEGLAAQVDELADSGGGRERPAPSWLALADPGMAPELLAGLIGWLGRVYLAYEDGSLPECWLWHPGVVEELVWLRHAWTVAYFGRSASVARAGDWHDRQRPGVVRRIAAAMKAAGPGGIGCALRDHQEQERPVDRPVPAADAAAVIAAWWADTNRPAAPPAPTARQLAAAHDRLTSNSRGTRR